MQRAGVPVTPHTALQVDVVHTAMRVISNAIIKMGDPRGYQVDFTADNIPYRKWLNPQPQILTNTFGDMFQYDGRRRTILSLGLFGEAFWHINDRGRGQYPTALDVINPMFMTVDADKDTGQPVYFYGHGVNRVQIPAEDIIHIPFMAMPGARRGLSSIEYAGVQYALALAAMEYGQRWFAQGASPSFLLSTDQKLGDDELKRIAEQFLIEHGGLQASHLPLVVDSGLKAEKISATPDEAQYINTLEYARTCIAAWFGLPSHLVGGLADKGNVWGKTIQEQSFQLVDFTLSGYLVPMEEAISQKLLPRGSFAAFDLSTIQRANAADLSNEITALRSTGVETPNEIRLKLGKAPKPGGDNLAAPLNSNIAPQQSASAASQEDSAGDEGGGGDEQ